MCARSDVPPPMYYGYAVANPPPPYGWVYPQNAAGGSVMQNRLPYTAPSGTFTGNADCVYCNTLLTNGFQPPATNTGVYYGGVANFP
ncbi:unnamed protein product, partial [Iphiclides podalirius]